MPAATPTPCYRDCNNQAVTQAFHPNQVALGREIEPAMAVITLALLNVLQVSLTKFFCNAVECGAQSIVSCRRISRLLTLPEQSRLVRAASGGDGGDGTVTKAEGDGSLLHVAGMQCKWSTASAATLSDVSFKVGKEEMLVIVGTVGAGKTSLLMAIMGELPACSPEGGSSKRLRPWEGAGRLAYAAQEPWILALTLRDNILLGKDFDQAI